MFFRPFNTGVTVFTNFRNEIVTINVTHKCLYRTRGSHPSTTVCEEEAINILACLKKGNLVGKNKHLRIEINSKKLKDIP